MGGLPSWKMPSGHFNELLAPCKGIPDSLGFQIPGNGLWILCQWNLHIDFNHLLGFPIPRGVFWTSKPKIQIPSTKYSWTLDSTSKIFLHSRFPYKNEVPTEGAGGVYFRIFWVGMCCWDPGTLNLYQS